LTGEGATAIDDAEATGDDMLKVLAALSNPHRLRVVAALAAGRNYVSQLARDLAMSRPLLHMHLKRLEAAGLVVGHLELGDEGKAMKFYEVAPFDLHLTPAAVAEAVQTMTAAPEAEERTDQ
jgi:DNA-binding transcriptional ArsR family regulator